MDHATAFTKELEEVAKRLSASAIETDVKQQLALLNISEVQYMVESTDYKDDWCEEQEAPAQLQDIHDRALEKANELAKKNSEMAGDVGILSEKYKTLQTAYAEKAAKLEELRRKLAAKQDSVSGKVLAGKMTETIKE
jgi:hypothetical protein